MYIRMFINMYIYICAHIPICNFKIKNISTLQAASKTLSQPPHGMVCDCILNLFTTFIENTTDSRKIAAQVVAFVHCHYGSDSEFFWRVKRLVRQRWGMRQWFAFSCPVWELKHLNFLQNLQQNNNTCVFSFAHRLLESATTLQITWSGHLVS